MDTQPPTAPPTRAEPCEPRAARRSRPASSGGFTLIEMLAVVAILALVAGMVLPGIAGLGGRALRHQGELLAADLELARERSLVLGVPHRVVLDLEAGAWRMEWFVTEAEAFGEASTADAPREEGDARGEGVDLAPPRGEELAYHPVPLSFGRDTRLESDAVFVRLETSSGPVTQGRVAVVFERDGSTDPLSIVLGDPEGREVQLDVEALDEMVGVHDAVR